MMTRRAFVTTLAGALVATPLSAGAQPRRPARIGVLLFSTPAADPNISTFRQAIRDLGWVEGRNLTLEYRYAEGRVERLPELAAELVRQQPDLIYVLGGDVAPSAKNATRTIPIVVAVSTDPVQAGLVPSLARPGGNLTGFTFALSDLAAKRLEMLHELAPRASRIAVLWNPDHADPDFRETQAAAPRLGVRIVSIETRRPDDFDAAFQTALRERADALIVVSSRLMIRERRRILEFAAAQRLPLATGWGAWAEGGALLTYGPPTRFELVINVKTAQALGLTLPQSLLVRADRVIQ